MKNYKKKLNTTIALFFSLFLFLTLSLSAQNAQAYNFAKDSGLSITGDLAGYDPGAVTSPEIIIGNIIQAILGLLGIIFLAFMIYAGITWMTAQGNDQKVTKAKQMITEAIVGLIIVVAAYAIAYFVISFFSANTVV